MKNKRLILGLTLFLLVMAFSITGVLAQNVDGQVRFVHVIPGTAAVDVYTDGQLTVKGLGFGEASTYAFVPAGSHTITVTPTGITTELWSQELTVGAGTPYTLIASSTEPLLFKVYEDDFTPLGAGTARFRIVHAIDGAPAIDALLDDGRLVSANIAYGDATGTIDVPAFVYNMGFVPTGEDLSAAIVEPQPFALSAGTSYIAIVYGRPTSPETVLLSAPVHAEAPAGFVRVVNASTSTVDVFANGDRFGVALATGAGTDHLGLAAGEYTFEARSVEGDETLSSETVIVEDGSALTLVVTDDALTVYVDNLAGVDASTARLNIINTSASEISLTLEDGTVLAEALASDDNTITDIAATMGVVTLTLDGQSVELPETAFYGGVLYDVIVSDESTVALLASPVAQSIASAPGAESVTVAVAEDTEATTQTSDDTSTEVVEAPQQEATEAPSQETEVVVAETPAPPPPPPPLVDEEVNPTATVLVNPGANLQLRQYPSPDAFSLGLAPSGAVLEVLGRAGEPIDRVTGEPLNPDYVDPATLLGEDEDLNPEDTWLFISYAAPDGGSVTAWVNALYLDVRDEDGKRQKLAELPTVPENTPGESGSEVVTPPPLPEDTVFGTVTNLNPGVNLKIRRTPETGGETLELMPLGTTVEILGVNDNLDWAFVRYEREDGAVITGWSATLYLDFEYNGEKRSLEDLVQREELEIIDTSRRGEIGSTTGAPVAPSVPTEEPTRNAYVAEVVLNPGANLHLRRSPDTSSESLALIPSGAQLIIDLRTEDGSWLHTTYEGQSGWIATQFVNLSYNGRPADIEDIPSGG
ncbi:MAG: DUF4397 domain-containing protein [Chloroflexi bacterium]|nr:MAG: DUF4397 domain-containing protein [Chloroflexota bacterium]